MILIWLACAPVTIKDPSENSINEEDTTNTTDSGIDTLPSDDTGLSDDPTDTDEPSNPDDEIWNNAQLIVTSPEPSSLYPLDEPTNFEAQIVDENGDVLDFDEITWHTSVDSDWEETGDSLEAELPVGEQVITANARLPNGDRLSYAVGGILVQHPDAGTYVGTTSIDLTINTQDQAYVVSCAGSATISVDQLGEYGSGDSACILSINGNDIESTYLFELLIEDSIVSGEAIVDLWLIQQGFPFNGSIGDGELSGSWAESVLGGYLDIAGDISLERVSIYPAEEGK